MMAEVTHTVIRTTFNELFVTWNYLASALFMTQSLKTNENIKKKPNVSYVFVVRSAVFQKEMFALTRLYLST